MQFRIAFGGLAERQPLPRTEIGLDQVVVDTDVEAERLGRRRGSVVRALQRRRDDGRDAARLREKLCGRLGLAPADVGQRRVASAGIPPLRG